MALARTKAVKRSATGVAALRYLGSFGPHPEVRNPDRLVGKLLPPHLNWLGSIPPTRAAARLMVDRQFPGTRQYHVARTRFIDDVVTGAVSDKGIRQVVILGAGLDTRAWRLTALTTNRAKIFELDYPDTSRRKREAARRAGLTQRVQYVETDFAAASLDQALSTAGMDRSDRVVFVWEGVSMFLAPAVVHQMLDQIGQAQLGSELVFDYVFADVVSGTAEPYGTRATRRYLERGGETWHFGVNAEDVADLLATYNLTVIANYGPTDLERRYLRLHNGRAAGRLVGFHGIAHGAVEVADERTVRSHG